MIDKDTCNNGVTVLKALGLKPTIDRTLKIAFNDPLAISADICKLQNRCAIQGTLPAYQASPTLYIDGKSMGPLNSLKVQEIKALAEPSPFGLGSKTIYDENVRKALEIKADRINLEIPRIFDLQRMAPMGCSIVPKLYKLAIYEKDGFFAEHADTLHGENHIGTLVMCLPVPHEGGTFILSDDENELRLPFDELIKDDVMPWVAFYTDVKHKIEVVKSGVRMTLQFDLIVELGDEAETMLYERVRTQDYNYDANNYYFQEYNQEVLNAIKSKLNTMFSKEKIPKKEEKNGIGKRDRSDDTETFQLEPTKQMKLVGGNDSEQEEEKEEEEEEEEKKENDEEDEEDDEEEEEEEEEEEDGLVAQIKKEYAKPDGVALMLKRRYGATTLSTTTLKGSDSALYHALKDNFIVEAKVIILEQCSDRDNSYEGQPMQVLAISQINEAREAYPSDEENEHQENKKYVPRKVQGSERYGSRYGRDYAVEWEEEKRIRRVCLVSGYSAKALAKIVDSPYAEATGNEATEAVYSYMHAALFIFPKESL